MITLDCKKITNLWFAKVNKDLLRKSLEVSSHKIKWKDILVEGKSISEGVPMKLKKAISAHIKVAPSSMVLKVHLTYT